MANNLVDATKGPSKTRAPSRNNPQDDVKTDTFHPHDIEARKTTNVIAK